MVSVDLHTHSNFSDGELSPTDLVDLAKEKQIDIFALTDHDNIDGNIFAAQQAQLHGIRFIHGVEISSQWQRPNTQKNYAVHIVALNMQDLLPMQQLLQQQKQHRAERALLICTKLQHILKIDILAEVRELVEDYDDRITRSHIAKVLLKKGLVTRVQQAFERFLKEGKQAYVPFIGVMMEDAIKIIHQCQGVAVLAHPTKYDLSATNTRLMIEQFAQFGGDALELPPTTETFSTRQMIDQMIDQFELKVSLGSDFHGSHMPWLTLGKVPKMNAQQRGIWEDFN